MTGDRQASPAIEWFQRFPEELGDVLDAGILTLGSDLVVRSWNVWLEEASGRAAAQVVGRSLLDVYPELRGTPTEGALLRAAQGSAVVLAQRLHRYLLPFPATPGTVGFEHMQQSVRVVPALNADRTVDGIIVVIHDVTARVAREQELRVAMERAEEANKAKSDFLASMSHELRTPLSAMVGYSDLLVNEMVGPLEPLQKDHLERLKTCAYHLLGIVEEILTFARAEAGHEEAHPVRTDATQLAWEAIAVVEPGANRKGLAVCPQVPDTPVILQTDPIKLRQILINLLGNAVKFTEQGTVRLEIDPLSTPGHVVFRVADTGPGISANDLSRIFDPFTQVDQSWTRPKGGTGLGLPVSRRLAQLLGGDVLVESERGVGSTFTVTLPISIPSDPTMPAAREYATSS